MEAIREGVPMKQDENATAALDAYESVETVAAEMSVREHLSPEDNGKITVK